MTLGYDAATGNGRQVSVGNNIYNRERYGSVRGEAGQSKAKMISMEAKAESRFMAAKWTVMYAAAKAMYMAAKKWGSNNREAGWKQNAKSMRYIVNANI